MSIIISWAALTIEILIIWALLTKKIFKNRLGKWEILSFLISLTHFFVNQAQISNSYSRIFVMVIAVGSSEHFDCFIIMFDGFIILF